MDVFSISFFIIISIFWFFIVFKNLLFWIYLWQLKEYHIGRFLAHFLTYQGKRIILHPLLGFKIILAILFFFSSYLFYVSPLILFIFYFSLTLLLLLRKNIKRPVLTKKTIFLIIAGFFLLVSFPFIIFLLLENIFWMVFFLLIFDIFTPDITSLIVLIFQPLTVFFRRRIIKKATKKINDNPDLITIGITGSYGKSSVKEFLSTILSQEFNVLKTKKNENSEMGVSRLILNNLKNNHQVFVCEMGAYNKGGIKLLANIVKPKIGIVTGVNEQHLATFGSMKNLLSAEGGEELIVSLPKEGMSFFNEENKYCLDLFKKTKIKDKFLYGTTDIRAENIRIKKDSLSFEIKNEERLLVDLNLIGKHNITNILGAVLCAQKIGIKKENIKKGLLKITEKQSAIKLVKRENDFDVLDSSYSSNPEGVLADLEHLNLWEGKKIVVMPCLIELGKLSDKIHKKIGRKINEVCDLAIITTKDRFKEIKKEVGGKAVFLNNYKEIAEKIEKEAGKNDVVLLEGRVPSGLSKIL